MSEELSPAGRFGLHHIYRSICGRQAAGVGVNENRSGQADEALSKAHLGQMISQSLSPSVSVSLVLASSEAGGGEGIAGSDGFQKEKENRTQSMSDRRRLLGSAARKRLDLAVRRQRSGSRRSFAAFTHTLSLVGCWGDLTNRLDGAAGYETDRGACAGWARACLRLAALGPKRELAVNCMNCDLR